MQGAGDNCWAGVGGQRAWQQPNAQAAGDERTDGAQVVAFEGGVRRDAGGLEGIGGDGAQGRARGRGHQRLVGQQTQVDVVHRGQRVVGCAGENQLIAPGGQTGQRGGQLCDVYGHEGCVQVVATQSLDGLRCSAFPQAQLHLGVAVVEGFEQGGHVKGRERWQRPQAQGPAGAAARAGHLIGERVDLGHDPLGAREHGFARRGGMHAPAVADEQLLTELALEASNLFGQRRLGDVQLEGGTGEAAVMCDGDEVAQLAKIHRPSRWCQSRRPLATIDELGHSEVRARGVRGALPSRPA